jgi:hypothetical protein
MRLFIFFTVFLSALPAWSCPDLQGSYALCKSQSGNLSETKDLVIQKTRKKGITSYVLEEVNPEDETQLDSYVRTEGLVETEVDPENGVMTQTKTFCESDKLVMDSYFSYLGEEIGRIKTLASKVGDRLIIEATGRVQGKDYHDAIICE